MSASSYSHEIVGRAKKEGVHNCFALKAGLRSRSHRMVEKARRRAATINLTVTVARANLDEKISARREILLAHDLDSHLVVPNMLPEYDPFDSFDSPDSPDSPDLSALPEDQEPGKDPFFACPEDPEDDWPAMTALSQYPVELERNRRKAFAVMLQDER